MTAAECTCIPCLRATRRRVLVGQVFVILLSCATLGWFAAVLGDGPIR